MFPNVSWKMNIWLLLKDCALAHALLGGSGTFTPPRNLFVEKLVNEALSLRPFICHFGFQFPITSMDYYSINLPWTSVSNALQ